jgi:hypothetical protein
MRTNLSELIAHFAASLAAFATYQFAALNIETSFGLNFPFMETRRAKHFAVRARSFKGFDFDDVAHSTAIAPIPTDGYENRDSR